MFVGLSKKDIKVKIKKDRCEPKNIGERLLLNYFDTDKIYSATKFMYRDVIDSKPMITYMIRNRELPSFIESLDCTDVEFNNYFEVMN